MLKFGVGYSYAGYKMPSTVDWTNTSLIKQHFDQSMLIFFGLIRLCMFCPLQPMHVEIQFPQKFHHVSISTSSLSLQVCPPLSLGSVITSVRVLLL